MTTTRPARRRSIAAIDRLEARKLLATLPSGFVESAVNSATLSSATAMQFAPDGKLFVLEQGGTIEVYQGAGSAAWTQVAPNSNFLSRASNGANHITTTTTGERGLLGIAFHPNYASNRYVYIYYTVSGTSVFNRISRFTANAAGTQVVENSETVLVNLDNLASATNHNGGALNFGTDGKLYVGVGDNATSANAQSIANRLGKILRYNDDGTIPADNPTSIAGIAGTPAGANRAIWAAGLRNPFTFAVHPTTGTLYINDVGQNTWEEINVGSAGANYGWSSTEGRFTQSSFPNFTNPIVAYPHSTSLAAFPTAGGNYAGFCIAGGAFYVTDNAVFPPTYNGDYFYADYVSNFIRTYDPATNSTAAFATNAGGPVDMRVGPDGRLFYLARNDGRVYRVDFPDTVAPTVTGSQFQFETAQRVVVNFSENVSASVSASDITVQNLTTNQTIPATGNWTIANTPSSTTVNFSPLLPDGRYRVTFSAAGITDAAGNPLAASAVVNFHVLAGDANRDQQVNFDDLLILAANYNSSPRTFSQGDFDYSGTVNFDDLLLLAAKYNTGVPAAPATLLAAPPPALTVDTGDDESPAEDPIF